ncbi:ATP-binding protein [uncultured Sphingomonas sp.]|uniref:sensor histidine kinase n=1 Tax=uncultured Sphingomonas sp. TaxID=158754 RepID=UPI0025E15A81|nr:sensor histidine kinase [uncultured Sphingomonas sp.]
MLQLDDRRFNRLALLALASGFALVLIAFGLIIATSIANQRAADWVQHTYGVTEELAQFKLAMERAETATRGYLLAPDPRRLRTFRENSAQVLPRLARVHALTRDNPQQQEALRLLMPKVRDQLALDADMMARSERGELVAARSEFVRRVKVRQIEQIRILARAMHQEELRLLAERQILEARRRSQLQWLLAIAGTLLLLLGGATYWLVRRYTDDLTQARDRLHLLNTDLESQVQLRTADLTRANEEIQRFAYIVSHDLRSPLVNVLGFTAELEAADQAIGQLIDRAEAEAPQLITAEVRHAREDLPEAIGFIRSSTQKMDRLINAILKLSRQGRRTLNREPLAMKLLLDDIAATLEQRLKDAGAALTIDPQVPDLENDRLAVEQIFSNLLENAIKYLQPGRPGRIEVRGSLTGDRVLYEVEDNGRGIDPADHERVFDLFRRAGRQDQPGEGIGLAHARALVHRLGGKIELHSTLGEGTTFRLQLLRRLSDGGGAD